MTLRLIVSDLDGTFLAADGTIPPINREAVERAAVLGVPFVVATGRPIRWLEVLGSLTAAHPWVIASNGALVWDLAQQAPITVRPIDTATLLDAVATLRSIEGITLAVETPDGFGCEPRCPAADLASDIVAPIADLIAPGIRVVKLLAFHTSMGSEELHRVAADRLGDRVTLTHSWSGRYGLLEISAPGVSKASALADLCRDLGIHPAEVAAFGDMPNDLSMLEWVGQPHVVAQAHPSLLRAGFPVVGPAHEGGVGHRILDLIRPLPQAGFGAGPSLSTLPASDPKEQPMDVDVLVGGYTPPHGSAAGITRFTLHEGALSDPVTLAQAPSPSFLAHHPGLDLLYAVAENDDALTVIGRGPSGWSELQSVATGQAPCHVRVHLDAVIVCCWGDGAVWVYPTDPQGRITDRILAPPAADPHRREGRSSRAHASLDLGSGEFLTTDLDYDLLRRWRWGPEGLTELGATVLPAGCGPRHLVRHRNLIHVVTEYSVEVLTFHDGPNGLELLQRTPARPRAAAAGDTGAEIAVSATGAWLSVGIRGSNQIAVLSLASGVPRPFTEFPCGGVQPRFHLHTPDGILVANQGSGTITLLAFDETEGTLGPVTATVTTGTPSHLVPLL